MGIDNLTWLQHYFSDVINLTIGNTWTNKCANMVKCEFPNGQCDKLRKFENTIIIR